MLGWAIVALALYLPSIAFVAAAGAVIRLARPRCAPSKQAIGVFGLVVAALLWYAIPLIIHARFGRADL